MKDVLLVGCGAVGAIYSLILKRSGLARVTVVARSNYEAVQAHGLDIRSQKYGHLESWRPDRLFPNVQQALDRPYSYVILTTKAIPELTRTPTVLAPLLSPPYIDTHPQPAYVIMQNGLGVEADLYKALKKLKSTEEPKIIGTAVWIGTGMLSDNIVEHNNFDRVQMGVYRPDPTIVKNTPAESALLEDFASILRAGGSDVTVVPEIQRIKYSKNFWNAVLGASAALSRFPLTAIFRPPQNEPGHASSSDPPAPAPGVPASTPSPHDPHFDTSTVPSASPALSAHTIPFLRDALAELYELGSALFPASDAGPGLEPDIVQRTLRNTANIHARPDAMHRASMLVDVEKGRPMEVEVVLGEVVRAARQKGVAVPRVEALYALLLIVQNQLLRQYKERKSVL
ncbi:ApbA-domain-containing protein [Obba rivulosa]|uniref:ApbA-domain-containing protein n=1 Tax=Obba rivulosa TaxID=1052685 RepID=A0A8E2DMW9_9APHY|nr:ApbA-domain-containing protein [Obba rivulosa]